LTVNQTSEPQYKPEKTILIVDDNPLTLDFVSKVLDAYHVITAKNGEDALRISQLYKYEIHLLLSDFEMPGMNGIALATAITLNRPLIKVLLMSGFDGGMLVLNEGWHFLAKPFIPSQLRTLVAGLISPQERFSRPSNTLAG
jgi:DNA-binding NtrC family response regulator